MNIQSLFPDESKDVITLEDCLSDIEIDRERNRYTYRKI